jgi:hypothetical protein
VKSWVIDFGVNLEEYICHLGVNAESVVQLDERTVSADGVLIHFEEDIVEVREEPYSLVGDS